MKLRKTPMRGGKPSNTTDPVGVSDESRPQAGFAPSLKAVAQIAGIPRSTLEKASAAGVIRKGPHGYSIPETIAWRTSSRGPVDETEREAKRRWTLAKARREELGLARDQGKVIEVSEHKRQLIQLARMFVGICERAGAELASTVAGHVPTECRKIIDAYMADRRAELVGERISGGMARKRSKKMGESPKSGKQAAGRGVARGHLPHPAVPEMPIGERGDLLQPPPDTLPPLPGVFGSV